ncbi:hypothetical protein [Komagataeibacter swingsii]|uniref:Uncharacterized protein n=1 Tax=Komagataeibacter swingsii TaxID=215220 RepID=A0A2V4RNB3_9PROT|nr:hypothetical protein [Komagataeibacter swingsii]PYD69082.1 hypothetical protein CFR76_11870 [Komagataeibacter swingsii]
MIVIPCSPLSRRPCGATGVGNLHGVDAEILDAQAVRRVVGIEISRDYIAVDKVGLACAGNSLRMAAMGGLRLPIERRVIMNGRETIVFTP